MFIIIHYNQIFFFFSSTPFSSGPSEDPAAILKRIGEEGSLNLDSGNWKSVSAQAKVQYIFYRILLKFLKIVQKIDIIDALYYDVVQIQCNH